jgi:predicted ATPase/DNA-binding XRE family transcriptional regulator
MIENISFGKWLRQRRRMLDLSQQALADQATCARITLSRIEANTLKPSKELALILLEKLGIPEFERPQWILFARGLSGFPTQPVDSFASQLKTNLPAALTTFIGRERELAEIIKLTRKYRLITLSGPGGVGKTRLSIKVGEQVLGDYADGVWLVELASLSDPVLLTQTVIKPFGIAAQTKTSPAEILINFLRAKAILLVLDNCEHLLEACAQLADTLLKNCANLKILATSRESLGITGEAAYPVPSLGLPNLAQLLKNFRDYESVRLFEERAQLAKLDFSLTLENASSVAQICHRLDGIPLAIELAAAHVNMFSTEQIAARLNESFNLLTGGSRTALPRQQTIRASIEWSWNLLSDTERILLRRLSIFAGGWILEAAESVCSSNDVKSDQILNLMTELVSKSLVVMNQDSGRDTRYHLLEIIRQYTYEKLKEAKEETAIRNRYLDFFVTFAENVEPRLKDAQLSVWLNRLETDRDNLRDALGLASSAGDFEKQARLASALARFWVIRGPMMEGRRWLESVFSHSEDLPLSICAKTYLATGLLVFNQGEYTAARPLLVHSLSLARELYDRQLMAESLRMLGITIHNVGDSVKSRELLTEGLTIFRELGEQWGIGWSLIYLAIVAKNEGDLATAYTFLEESLKVFRQLDEKRSIAWSLIELASIAYKQQDYMKTESFSRESLTLFDELGDKRGIDQTLRLQGNVACKQHKLERASSLFIQSLNLNHEQGDQEGIELTLAAIAKLAFVQNNFSRAAQLIGWADARREKIGDPRPLLEQADVDRDIAAIMAKIGSSAFGAAYDEGHSMTLDQAVMLALDTKN